MKNFQVVFHSYWNIFIVLPSIYEASIFSISLPAVAGIQLFFILAILMGIQWYLIAFFIYISLMTNTTNDTELIDHFCIFVGNMSSWVLCSLLNWLICLLICWIVWVLHLFLIRTSPLSDMICKCFLPLCGFSLSPGCPWKHKSF